MIVKCEKAGSRGGKCESCSHGVPHTYRHDRGCDCGNCFPPMMIKGEDGIEVSTPYNPNCVEIKEVDI